MDPAPPLRDIGCFALVARHLSFSRAAAEMGVSQPAASQAVGRLERVLGVRLFERTSREVRLTPAGKALLPYAETLLESATAFSAEARRLAAPADAGVRLAYPPLVGGLAARVARRMARRDPPAEVDLRPAGRAACLAAVAAGEVTATILASPFPRDLTTAARFHVPVSHLAVPAGDPLAALPRLQPERLARHRVLVPRERPRAACGHGSPPASNPTGSMWWPRRSTTTPPHSTWSRRASACCRLPLCSSRPSAGTTSPLSRSTRATCG